MKKKLRLLFTTLLCVGSLLTFAQNDDLIGGFVYEYPFVDGIWYAESTYDGVCAFWYDESYFPDGNLVIPSSVTINGVVRPVVLITTFNSGVPLASNHTIPLKSIYIPESVVSIASHVFSDDYLIDKVIWDAPNCEDPHFNDGIKSIEFGEHITNIPNSFCYYCSNLSSVTFGKDITSIGEYAFAYSGISTVEIPHTVTSIADWAFGNNDNLKKVVWDAPNCEMYNWYGHWLGDVIEEFVFGEHMTNVPNECCIRFSALKTVIFNSNILSIGENAFWDCGLLSTISLPQSVQTIGRAAFENSGLTSITLSSNLKEIDDYAFESCDALKKVTIPNKVTKIGDHAFANCDALTSVTIGKAVTDFDTRAFENTPIKTLKWNAKHCEIDAPLNLDKLTSITFGSSVEYVPSYICWSAVKLPSVTFPQSVKEIGEHAFYDCTALTELTIPENITKINDGAFSYCDNVKTVTCGSSTPPTLGSSVFDHIAEDAVLRVPCGSLNSYKKKSWKNYFSKFEEYFPYYVNLSSADETMGTVVLGDINCTDGSVQIDALANNGFAFVAWSDGNTDASRILQVTQDTTLVATFKVQTFHITFVDWNGTLIQESDVNSNTIPSKPNNPTRPATAQYTYSFKAWDPEVVAALADAVYMAQYDSVLNEYTVTFLNEDGSLIESKKWKYGEMPSCDEPAKESTAEMAYHFDHWNPAIETVTGEATYKAVFRAVPIYTLVFLDWNGDLIDVVKAEEGTAAILPADPARTGHTFVGWSRDLTSIRANMYVIALYEAVGTGIDVIFKSSDDRILSTQSADLSLPVVPETEQPGFLGWFVESGNLSDGIIIRAHNESTPTAITESPARQKEQISKIIHDGQILILRGNKVYTITGQTVW